VYDICNACACVPFTTLQGFGGIFSFKFGSFYWSSLELINCELFRQILEKKRQADEPAVPAGAACTNLSSILHNLILHERWFKMPRFSNYSLH